MNRRTIARVIAVILLSYGLAFVMVNSHKSDMARYRSLNHQALLADLAKTREGDFSITFGGALLGVGVIVALIEGITATLVFVINRIAPLHPPGTLEPGADAIASRFH
jgi:hypothetical protein